MFVRIPITLGIFKGDYPRRIPQDASSREHSMTKRHTIAIKHILYSDLSTHCSGMIPMLAHPCRSPGVCNTLRVAIGIMQRAQRYPAPRAVLSMPFTPCHGQI